MPQDWRKLRAALPVRQARVAPAADRKHGKILLQDRSDIVDDFSQGLGSAL
ncbi:MAG: hypothetical protein ACRC1J_08520 [Sandaracinobacteroides sp.]